MAKLSKLVSIFLLASVSWYSQSYADSAQVAHTSTAIDYYDVDNKTNQIPYFDNRFRIDALVDEITLLFYRKSGTPPIILVQPDGSKLKINQIDKTQIEWFDDRTFDMIKIKKPMPGPWQAIGEIEPHSHIMVMSEVKIEVEPLPSIMLAGETIKVTGTLFNGKEAIDTPSFRDVVRLDVDFHSTNNTAYSNFGAEIVQLTSFRDDGRNLDEYAGDGIFTGEFELTFAPGEWIPIYYVKLPMASRELRQKPIIVHENPITLSVETTQEEGEQHQLLLSINHELVDPDSLVFQGKITFPDRQVEPFSVMEGQGKTRLHAIEYTESGIYRVNVSAFGHTVDGREFRLVVPEYTFNVKPKEELVTIINDEGETVAVPLSSVPDGLNIAEQEVKPSYEEELEMLRQQELAKQAEEEQKMLLYIGIGNGIVILIALIAFITIRFKRSKK